MQRPTSPSTAVLAAVLASLDDGKSVARSVRLFEPMAARGWDRVDFTADRIFFHLTTDANDADSAEQTAIVSLPRRNTGAESSASRTATTQGSNLLVDRPETSAQVSPLIKISLCGSPNVGCIQHRLP